MSFYTSEDRITVDLKLHVNYSEEKFKNKKEKSRSIVFPYCKELWGKKKKILSSSSVTAHEFAENCDSSDSIR